MVQACPVRGPDVVNTKDHSLPATVILGAETPWRASGDNEAAAASKKREPALDTYSLLKGKMDAYTSNMSERWLGLLSRLLIPNCDANAVFECLSIAKHSGAGGQPEHNGAIGSAAPTGAARWKFDQTHFLLAGADGLGRPRRKRPCRMRRVSSGQVQPAVDCQEIPPCPRTLPLRRPLR